MRQPVGDIGIDGALALDNLIDAPHRDADILG
jgi:hypothetical protein